MDNAKTIIVTSCATIGSETPSRGFALREHLSEPWGENWINFAAAMERLGLTIHEAHGPGGWGGPAVTVTVERVPTVVAAAQMKLEHHGLGNPVHSVMIDPAPTVDSKVECNPWFGAKKIPVEVES